MNTPVQLAAPALLQERKRIQPLLLDRLRENLQALDRALARQTLCQRLDMEGGWYAVLRVPATQTDEELATNLIRKIGVMVHPGHFFDFATDGYLVLSLITPTEVFRAGVNRLLDLLGS